MQMIADPHAVSATSRDGVQLSIDQDRALTALLTFPAPLILVARLGMAALANQSLTSKFGAVRLDRAAILHSLQSTTGPFVFTLEPLTSGPTFMVSAMATDFADWHVLLIGDPTEEVNVHSLRQLVRLVLELEREAATDKLTGTWNRARFDRVIRPEIELPSAPARSLTLALIDIDDFKKVNETHGRGAGDALLVELAGFIRARIRATDELFRWGGDEFAILVRDASQAIGERVAEKLRAGVEQHAFETVGRISLSAGVAEHAASESLVEWIGRVDSALYRAKTSGKNRVEAARADVDEHQTLSPALHLTWLERYECGEPTIDRQHRELFDRSNELLNEVLRAGRNVAPMVDRLVSHICNHFADEESILAEHDYPGLERHKRSHRELITKALRMQEAAAAGRVQLGEVAEFVIGQIVTRHLLHEDRRFASLFGKPGPAPDEA